MNKKYLLMLLLWTLSFGVMMAQDVIVKKDGSTIIAKVEEIGSSEIKYKKWSNLEGPTYSVSRSDIASINYQNGEVERFSDVTTVNTNTNDQPIHVGGKMAVLPQKKKCLLTLNGNKLSENEIKSLLGNDAYEEYLSGNRLWRASRPFEIITFVCIVPTVVGLTVGYGYKNYGLISMGWTSLGTMIPCMIVDVALGRSGFNKINDVVTEYNDNNNKPVSLHFSPSIISAEQFGQSDLGLGMTFSITF